VGEVPRLSPHRLVVFVVVWVLPGIPWQNNRCSKNKSQWNLLSIQERAKRRFGVLRRLSRTSKRPRLEKLLDGCLLGT
jgi:hypothetical protein